MSAILSRLPRRLSIRLCSRNLISKNFQCSLSRTIIRYHSTTIQTDVDIINTETNISLNILPSNEITGFSDEVRNQMYMQIMKAQIDTKQAEKIQEMENEIQRLKQLVNNNTTNNIETLKPIQSFEDIILSILQQPQETLLPLQFGENIFSSSKEYFQQFIPYITNDIYKSIKTTIDKIDYKQYKPIKSRLLATINTDNSNYVSIYIACKHKNLPKLDHSFSSEAICLKLNNETSLYDTTNTTNSNNNHNFIIGIAKKIDNFEKEKNKYSVLRDSFIYDNEKCLKILLKKNDYDIYYNNIKNLFYNTDEIENFNFENVSLYWHHLCGIIPSLRQYNACVSGFKPSFYTQVQNLEAIVWPELTPPAVASAVVDVVADVVVGPTLSDSSSSTSTTTSSDSGSNYSEGVVVPVQTEISGSVSSAIIGSNNNSCESDSAALEVPVKTELNSSDSTTTTSSSIDSINTLTPAAEVVVPAAVAEVVVPPEYTRVLNTQQQNVVAALTSPDAQGIYCLIGPPGTGKTTTTVQLLAERVRKYPTQKILLTGPSNKAIQVVLKQLLENIENPPLVVLIGVMRKEVPKHLQEVYAAKYADCLNKLLLDALQSDTDILKKIKNIKIVLYEINQRLKKIITSKGCIVNTTINKHILSLYKDMQIEEKKFLFAEIEIFDDNVLEERVSNIYSRIDSCAFSLDCYLTQKAQIIFSTLVASGRTGLYKIIKKFDTVFVDEASQALLPETFIPFKYDPKLFVLIGDPQQLPGSVSCQSLVQMGYADSLMARLTQGISAPYVQMLTTQYRMHPSIGKWSSDCFYDRQLTAAAGLEDRFSPLQQLPASMLLRDHPSAFIDVASLEEKGLHGEITNVQEAEAVVITAKYLLDKGIQPEQIGIITFYAAQARLITEKLRLLEDPLLTTIQDRFTPPLGLTVSTVDGFQGDERDITLISCVRSSISAGFMNDHRRINVATSRAKHARWIFGNKDGLSRSNTVFKDYFHWTGDDTENNTLPRTQVFSRTELYRSLSKSTYSKYIHNQAQNRQKEIISTAAAAGITPSFDASFTRPYRTSSSSISSSSSSSSSSAATSNTTATATTTTPIVPTVFINSDALKVTEQWW